MRLPSTFCDFPFVDGIVMLLKSDMNQVVIKAMELLYHHWDLLRDSHRHAFMQVMLSGEGCNRLFLHWDGNVRQFYNYLLIYRMIKGSPSDRKERVDVYAFLGEFLKGEAPSRRSLSVLAQKKGLVGLESSDTCSFFQKTGTFEKTYFRVNDRDITSLVVSHRDFPEVCKRVQLFSAAEFVGMCRCIDRSTRSARRRCPASPRRPATTSWTSVRSSVWWRACGGRDRNSSSATRS